MVAWRKPPKIGECNIQRKDHSVFRDGSSGHISVGLAKQVSATVVASWPAWLNAGLR